MSTIKANYILDAAGGNTATINGKLPIAIGDVPAGVTLLGTITTTSGSTVTLSGLTLTSYKQLQFIINTVSGTSTNAQIRLNGVAVGVANATAATDYGIGGGTIDLTSGVFWTSSYYYYTGGPSGFSSGGPSGLTTASTSISFTISAGTFDAGSITIYGVR